MKRNAILFLLLVPAMAWAFDFSAVAPSGQTLYYDIASSATVTVVSPGWSGARPQPIGSLIIPSTVEHEGTTYRVTTIGARAFLGCSGLTSVEVSEGMEAIEQMAFYNCTALDTIILPTTIGRIATAVFQRTAFMDNDSHWQDSLLLIGNYAVAARTQLTTATVPEGVKGVANAAFYYCAYLTDISLPSTLQFIGGLAFSDDAMLDTVRLAATVPPTLADDAFQGVEGLVVTVPCSTAAVYAANPMWSQHTLVETACDTVDPGPDPGPGPGPGPEPTAVDEADMASVCILPVEGGLEVSGAEGHSLAVYDAMGRRVAQVAKAGVRQRMALPSKGIYVVVLQGTAAHKVCYFK